MITARLRNLGRRAQRRWHVFRARHPAAVQTLKRAAVVGGIVGAMGVRARVLGKASRAAWTSAHAVRWGTSEGLRRVGAARLATAAARRWKGRTIVAGLGSLPYLSAPAMYAHGRKRKARREARLVTRTTPNVVYKRRAL